MIHKYKKAVIIANNQELCLNRNQIFLSQNNTSLT
jgi:hypothetical protein